MRVLRILLAVLALSGCASPVECHVGISIFPPGPIVYCAAVVTPKPPEPQEPEELTDV